MMQSTKELNKEAWEFLERLSRQSAAVGGLAAMGYYKNAIYTSKDIENSRNSATDADIQSTLAILQTLTACEYTAISNLNYIVFAEELEKKEGKKNKEREKKIQNALKQLSGLPIANRIRRTVKEFREGWNSSVAILFDALDGTANFRTEVPFFCSAVSIFLDGRPVIGAIYDPIHNEVYYASLEPGNWKANVWHVQTGSVTNLMTNKPYNKLNIATHITRSNDEKRKKALDFLKMIVEDMSKMDKSKKIKNKKNKNKLAGIKCDGIYMLNSGQLALSYVASRKIMSFVNTRTKIWDVAAGEVLIKAIGGKVTDFKGKEIEYGEKTEIDVVASYNPKYHKKLLDRIACFKN